MARGTSRTMLPLPLPLLAMAVLSLPLYAETRFLPPAAAQEIPHSAMTAIEQGPEGFLWFGTVDGLFRYDGYEFVPVGADVLRDDNITALEIGFHRDIWIGTRAGGLYRYDASTRSVSRVHVSLLRPDEPITSLAAGADGHLRVGTADSGLIVVDTSDLAAKMVGYDPLVSPSLNSPTVHRVHVDRAGFTYAVSPDRGVAVISPDLSSVYPLLPAGSTRVSDVIGAGSITVLFATDLGIVRYTRASSEEEILSTERVDRMLLRGEYLWAARGSTVFRMEAETGMIVSSYNLPSRVLEITADFSGGVWAVTRDSGPLMAVLRHDVFTVPDTAGSAGVSTGVVRSVAIRDDGSVLVGTDENGVKLYDPSDGTLRDWYTPGIDGNPAVRDVAVNGALAAVALGERGALLLEGLSTPRVVASVSTPTNAVVIAGQQLVLGTDEYGIVPIPLGSEASSAVPMRVDGRVTALAVGPDGTIWVGTDAPSIFRYDPEDRALTRLAHPFGAAPGVAILSIVPQRDGTLAIAAREGGAGMIDTTTGAIRWLVRPEWLDVDLVHGVAMDSLGAAWVTTNDALVRYFPDSGNERWFARSDGLRTDSFTPGATETGPRGEIVLGTSEGVVRFQPEAIEENPYVPTVVFTGAHLPGGREIAWEQRTASGAPPVLTVPPGENGFAVSVSALDFSNPEAMTYSHRLESHGEWQSPSPDNRIVYSGLPPGTYELRIRATNSDGLTNATGAAMTVVVTPRFWETAYFLALAILVITGILWLSVRMGLARAQEQREVLQQAVTRRTADLEASKHALEQEIATRRQVEKALNEIQAELEHRVAFRTSALREANESLAREVLERREAQEQTAETLAQNQALLQEVHHRVKNNMQVISSLLSLQATLVQDAAARRGFVTSRERIGAMALIHDRLYHGESFSNVDMGEYFNQLTKSLAGLHGRSIRVETIVNSVSLELAVATPCGLITNELVTNAMKHAFPVPQPPDARIRIEFAIVDGKRVLRVADNGRGIATAESGAPHVNGTSLGMRIVEVLVSQIDGTLGLRTGSATRFGRGTEFEVRF